MAAVLRHPSAARRLLTPIEHIRDKAAVSSLGTSAFALHDDSDLEAELRLARRLLDATDSRWRLSAELSRLAHEGHFDGRLFWTVPTAPGA